MSALPGSTTATAAEGTGHSALPDFHDAPGHLFRRGRQIHDALWLGHIGHAPTPLQYAVLTALELEPGIDQQTVGDRVALDKSTVGDLVARLSRRNLVRAVPDPGDARRKLLHLTDEGRAALHGTAPLVRQIGEEILAPLSPAEARQLLTLLDRLVYQH